MTAIGILIIGDEILSGRRQDQHFARTLEALKKRGMSLSWAAYVGDDPQRITAELKRALAAGDVVFSFGGIGATPDDHTRACAARAVEQDLVPHPQARELILNRLRVVLAERGEVFDPESPYVLQALQMGYFPVGADLIPNPYNQIPGFRLGDVHFFPGFPVMAGPMMEWVLDTRYPHLQHVVQHKERAVIVLGAMEAALTSLMQTLEEQYPLVKVFSLPSINHPEWGHHIELGVKGHPAQVDQAYEQLVTSLQERQLRLGPETSPV